MILTAFKKVPNELNKKFSYKEVRKLPFKITITGRISASLTIENVTDELKSALETKFGRDSNFFDPNGVGKYILIKKKRRLGIYRNAGLFPRLFIWNLSSGMSPTAFTISFIWIQKTPPLIFRMRRSDATFWFNNRLTSAKQKSLLYKSLADLVQSMMDTFVDPWLERITNRKSIFSMSKEDLETEDK